MFNLKAKKESAKHSLAIKEYIRINFSSDESVRDAESSLVVGSAAPMPKCARASRMMSDELCEKACASFEAVDSSLDEYLASVKDESFAQMLFRKIDEKGLKDSECYKKANIDKRLFSKIRSDALYKPSKQTAIAFILALELPFAEACKMLKKAGFAFSSSSKADLIVEYYIKRGIYDIFTVNASLYEFDQPLIGFSKKL